MKTLIHACCAPCLLAPAQALRDEGLELAARFYNPNIHPLLEFRKRVKAVRVFMEFDPLPMTIDEEYGLDLFIERIYDPAPARRCENCYAVRLGAAAAFARANGFDAFTTTLLGSPHQDHDLIRSVGERAVDEAGVAFLYRDFRPLHERSLDMAKRRRLYRQSYCGCICSEYERFRNTTRELYRGSTAASRGAGDA